MNWCVRNWLDVCSVDIVQPQVNRKMENVEIFINEKFVFRNYFVWNLSAAEVRLLSHIIWNGRKNNSKTLQIVLWTLSVTVWCMTNDHCTYELQYINKSF